MSTLTHDTFWHGTTIGAAGVLQPWLHDHGSLTRRIQLRCHQFAVQPLRSSLARIAHDEAALLGIRPHQLAYSREVFLHADGKPVVFAHSACAPRHLHGAWAALAGLGNRPLGAMLFTHPLVVRQPLRFKALRAHHPLYQRAAAAGPMPHTLWARRSLFTLYGAPLLVTEVFLPSIAKLPNDPLPLAGGGSGRG
ncbi:MAG TPA: chorismate lyase [Gallionellaceae bacterium]